LIDIIGQILSYVKFFEVIMINAVFNSRTQHLHYEFYVPSLPIKARAEDSFAITFCLSLEEVYALADHPGNGAVWWLPIKPMVVALEYQ